MNTDDFNKTPDNRQDEELTSILKRLSELLDTSVSLQDAVDMLKKQPEEVEQPKKVEEPEEVDHPEEVEQLEEVEQPEEIEETEEVEDTEEVEQPEIDEDILNFTLIPKEQKEEAEISSSSSKIFDELLACFENRKLPDDFRFASQTNVSEQEEETEEVIEEAQEEIEQETDSTDTDVSEDKNEEESTFVPLSYERDKDDELFSQIFSEEKQDRKNKERDKKKWQQQNNGTSKALSSFYDWIEVIVLSAAFALMLFTFVFRLAVVDGDSMKNTLHNQELLIISNLMYTPEENDIIVFNAPSHSKEPLVKRIIATAGQTIDMDPETWTVTVDGVPLDETYINRTTGSMNITVGSPVSFPLTVPEGYVFVMGDNRTNSLDSRDTRIGLVDERYVLGKVIFRLSPLDKIGKVN